MSENLRPPVTVVASVIIMIVAGIVGVVVNLFLRHLLSLSAPGFVGAVLGIGFAVLLYWSIWHGRKWARMFFTIGTGLGVVVVLLGIAIGFGRYTWFDVIGQLVTAGLVVLLWLPVSRAYFDAATKARRDALPKPPETPPDA